MAKQDPEMKLVHITTVPQSLIFVQGQVGYMTDRGLYVEAISSSGQKLLEFGESHNVSVHSVEMLRRISPIHDLKSVWQLSRTLRRIKPTIVHAHTPKGGLLGMISAWLTRTPVRIYHIHGLRYMTASGMKRSLLKAMERLSCALANEVFCVSHSIRDVAVADNLVSVNKIVVFAGGSVNGVDADGQFNPDRFTPDDVREIRKALGISETDIVIGFVGRIVRDKGVEDLAQSWISLRNSHPNARLVLVGPIELEDPVSPEAIAQLQGDDRVTIVDWVDDTSPYYSVFDMLVLPTYREGFGNVNIEAASMGIPVVSTDTPGCVDSVQDGVTGKLVPVGDSESLTYAIQMYLDDRTLRQRHGEAGRQRVLREFRQEVIWEAIYQEYCDLLGEKGLDMPKTREELE